MSGQANDSKSKFSSYRLRKVLIVMRIAMPNSEITSADTQTKAAIASVRGRPCSCGMSGGRGIIALTILALCATACAQGTTAGGTGSQGGTSSTQAPGNITLSSVAVTPNPATQDVGQFLGFRATGTLSNGIQIDLTPYATWTISNQVIASPVGFSVTQSFQCLSAGTTNITATYLGIVGSSAFTCVGLPPPVPTPTSIAISPTSQTIPQGQAGGVQYTATETFSDGSTQNVTASAAWSTSNSAIVALGPLTTTQEFDCVGTGSANVQVTKDSLNASTSQVCSAVLSTITVTPASPSVIAGNTFQFTATCNFTDGSSSACAAPTWSSSATTVATINSTGLATAVAAGTSTITAALGAISGTTVLTVTSQGPPPATLSSLTVTPSSKTVNVGSTLTLTATGNYSDGSTANVSAAPTVWSTSDSTVGQLQLADAVVGSSYSQTLAGTGSTPYEWSVPAATSSGQVDLIDFALMPLPTRNSNHMSATGLYKAFHLDAGLFWWIKSSSGNPWDGETYDGGKIYHWFTEDGDAADQPACVAAGYSSCWTDPFAYKRFVNPVPVAPRYFTLGGADVVVKSPGPNNFQRTTNCGADNQPLINLGNIMGITHDAGNVAWGGSVGTQRTIEIQYYWGIANETTVPPQSGTRERYELAQGFGQIQWDTSHWNGTGWTIDQTSSTLTESSGSAPTPNFGCKLPNFTTAGNLPPGTISAAHPQLNLADNTGVISGTPNTAGIYNFVVQQEDAGGSFHMQPQTIVVNQTATTVTQTVKCLSAGTVTLTATDGAVSNNTTVTCQSPTPTLSSIAVTPTNPSQFNGSSVQFTATGTYSDASTKDLTTQVTWSSSNTAVATITATASSSPWPGTCVASSGTSTITATLGAVSGNTTLTCQAVVAGTTENAYCTTGGAWIGPTTDGFAALPTACMNTALSNTPSPGTTRGPDSTTATVQADINAAACGDTVLVTAGSILAPITLPHKGCDSAHWITIKSTGVSNALFPAEGTRATPCIAGVASMPGRLPYSCPTPTNLAFQVVAPSSGSALLQSGGADHYRIIGAELTRTSAAKALIFSIVDLSGAGTQANNIIFDRVWCHGIEGTFPQNTSTDTSTTRCIYLGQSNHVALINSTVSNIYDNGATASNGNTDSQCIGGGAGNIQLSGWGIYKVYNNHMECGSEGVILGGSGGPAPTPAGCSLGSTCTLDVPTDIEIRQNYFFAPNSWNCNTTSINTLGCPNRKNGFEMKTGARGLAEGNVFENCWYSSQPYCYVMDLAPKNQMTSTTSPGTCPTCLVQDWTLRYNYGYNYPGDQLAVYTTSFVGGCAGCGQTLGRRISIHDNLVGDKLNTGSVTGVTGYDCIEFEASAGPLTQVSFTHNTCVNAVRSAMIIGANAKGQLDQFVFQNNIVALGNYGVLAAVGGCDSGFFYNILNSCINGTTNTWTADHNGAFNWSTANLGSTLGNGWPTNGKGLGNSFFIGNSGVGFASYGTGDSGFNPSNYALNSTSPLHNAGSDGKDLGADITTLLTKIAGVRQ